MSEIKGICPICGGYFLFDRKVQPILLCGHLDTIYHGTNGGYYELGLTQEAKKILKENIINKYYKELLFYTKPLPKTDDGDLAILGHV